MPGFIGRDQRNFRERKIMWASSGARECPRACAVSIQRSAWQTCQSVMDNVSYLCSPSQKENAPKGSLTLKTNVWGVGMKSDCRTACWTSIPSPHTATELRTCPRNARASLPSQLILSPRHASPYQTSMAIILLSLT